ncbi:hypothetical protein [Desulfobotulus alkaliphilus]|uniref:hypothetical protein n=1 Tax=Desulfobotulus alkaliphilus TaxID=622671 RepID=UPI0016487C0F|nr:hypothetical protein [Desulfobotulus alkaliphilus]
MEEKKLAFFPTNCLKLQDGILQARKTKGKPWMKNCEAFENMVETASLVKQGSG